MIIVDWTSFRCLFSIRAFTTSVSLTYNNANPDTITRGSGSFATDGFEAGMKVDVTGTANNDFRFTVGTVAALTLTLAASDSLTAEGPVTSSLVGAYIDPDGLEQWPLSKVRSGGIGSITGIPKPFTAFPFTVTINGGANDAAMGVDEYDWYLSQRTDLASSQYLSASAVSNKSGSLLINKTALWDTTFTDGITPSNTLATFKNVHLYVQRKSDKAIAWASLYDVMTT